MIAALDSPPAGATPSRPICSRCYEPIQSRAVWHKRAPYHDHCLAEKLKVLSAASAGSDAAVFAAWARSLAPEQIVEQLTRIDQLRAVLAAELSRQFPSPE